MKGIRILTASPLTTVQDQGRTGYQRMGVPVSGAADQQAHRVGQLLVGGKPSDAGLEMTLAGPEIEFLSDNIIAVTGANLTPRLDGILIPMYRALRVQKGQILSFGGRISGLRAYVAFAGGLDVPPVMGSRSTHLPSAMGGFQGRKLAAGDEIGFLHPASDLPNLAFRAAVPDPIDEGCAVLRVILGPQQDRFTQAGLETFLHSTYTVTPQSDRMGVRLSGEAIAHVADANILSDGIAPGAIQVPDSGQPILMLADRQTTGGYTKIANVITVDLPRIAQRLPGDTVRFEAVSLQEAQALYLAQLRRLETLASYF